VCRKRANSTDRGSSFRSDAILVLQAARYGITDQLNEALAMKKQEGQDLYSQYLKETDLQWWGAHQDYKTKHPDEVVADCAPIGSYADDAQLEKGFALWKKKRGMGFPKS